MSASEELLEAVLTELLSEVAVLADAEGFYVEDDGPGIPPDLRERAFDTGFTTGDGGENTGVGLAIVESVADSHGWRVRATEGRDGGARFEARL